MTTVINNPGNKEGGDGIIGTIIGIIIFLVLLTVFFVYVIPAIRDNNGNNSSVDVNLKLPAGATE